MVVVVVVSVVSVLVSVLVVVVVVVSVFVRPNHSGGGLTNIACVLPSWCQKRHVPPI